MKTSLLLLVVFGVLAAWNRWVDHADYDRQHDAYGLQALAFRAMVVDCQALMRFYVGESGALELQLLPAGFLDASANREGTVAGVEFDQAGRRVAYWLFEQHPGNVGGSSGIQWPASF